MCRVLALVDKCVYSNYIAATITTNKETKNEDSQENNLDRKERRNGNHTSQHEATSGANRRDNQRWRRASRKLPRIHSGMGGVMQRWIDNENSTRWVEFDDKENPKKCSSILARFYHKSGELLRKCYVPSKYILAEFTKQSKSKSDGCVSKTGS